jgi:hypothetical protein
VQWPQWLNRFTNPHSVYFDPNWDQQFEVSICTESRYQIELPWIIKSFFVSHGSYRIHFWSLEFSPVARFVQVDHFQMSVPG